MGRRADRRPARRSRRDRPHRHAVGLRRLLPMSSPPDCSKTAQGTACWTSPLPLPFPTRFLQGTADADVLPQVALRLAGSRHRPRHPPDAGQGCRSPLFHARLSGADRASGGRSVCRAMTDPLVILPGFLHDARAFLPQTGASGGRPPGHRDPAAGRHGRADEPRLPSATCPAALPCWAMVWAAMWRSTCCAACPRPSPGSP